MKKLIYIATMALGVLATSCADDFLTTEPNSTIDSEIVNEIMAADVEQLQAYISAGYDEHYWAYQKASESDELGAMHETFFTDLMAGDATSPQRLYGWFVWDMQNDNRLAEYRRPRSLWAPMYYIITNCCNPVIETLANLEEQTETTKSILYQAYALRAYNYFKLINYFQQPYQVNKDALGIPLYTEDATKNIPGRATVAQIYDQIISDLDKAYALAEGKGFENGKTALSEYSIALIYANVLLFTGDYENSAKYAEKAMEGANLITDANTLILNGFNSIVDMTETLWGYDVTAETAAIYASFMSYMCPYMPGYAGMGDPVLIDTSLYEKINAKDIRKNWWGMTLAPGMSPADVLPEFMIANGWGKTCPNKFLDVALFGGGMFESDMIFQRVAEAYFVAAEAYYLAKDETNAKKVLNDIMKTRIEGYNCTLSGEALYEEICLQKRIELWGEGKRLFDVKRRNESINREGRNFMPEMAVTNFNGQDAVMVYQIPKSELDNNDFITPDQQNP